MKRNLRTLSLFLCFIHAQWMLLLLPTISQPDFYYHTCSDKGNYTNDSPFKKNLDTVLLSISSNTQVDYGFYSATSGEVPDRVTALALCRVGVPLELCRSCVNNSTLRISQNCPNQIEAEGWYHDCQIRYSSNSIYGVGDKNVKIFYWNTNNAASPEIFKDALMSLMDPLPWEPNSIRKSAGGSSPSMDTIYGLLDCFPDLSNLNCFNCLDYLQRSFPSCNASLGAGLLATTCQLRPRYLPRISGFLVNGPFLIAFDVVYATTYM